MRGWSFKKKTARDIAGPERIDTMDVPTRLWSWEGRRRWVFLPALALIAEAPDRRLVKCKGMRGFTDKIFHHLRERTDVFQGDGAIFFLLVWNSPRREGVFPAGDKRGNWNVTWFPADV